MEHLVEVASEAEQRKRKWIAGFILVAKNMNPFSPMSFFQKNKILFVFLTLLVLAFYWYSLRPSLIKRNCYLSALEKAKNSDGRTYDQSAYNDYYRLCTEKNGL